MDGRTDGQGESDNRPKFSIKNCRGAKSEILRIKYVCVCFVFEKASAQIEQRKLFGLLREKMFCMGKETQSLYNYIFRANIYKHA